MEVALIWLIMISQDKQSGDRWLMIDGRGNRRLIIDRSCFTLADHYKSGLGSQVTGGW
jgi:hypothetical protein